MVKAEQDKEQARWDQASLLDRAKQGDEASFELLMKNALPKVLSVSRRMIRDESEAWDVAQEAFVKAWNKLGEFRGDAAFSTWVCGIASRVALDRIRSRRHESTDEVDERTSSDRPGPSESAERRSLARAISSALDLLSESERTVFMLHEESGMKYREVSAALDIPIGTVMSRLHSARSRLQKILEPWWKEMTA